MHFLRCRSQTIIEPVFDGCMEDFGYSNLINMDAVIVYVKAIFEVCDSKGTGQVVVREEEKKDLLFYYQEYTNSGIAVSMKVLVGKYFNLLERC